MMLFLAEEAELLVELGNAAGTVHQLVGMFQGTSDSRPLMLFVVTSSLLTDVVVPPAKAGWGWGAADPPPP